MNKVITIKLTGIEAAALEVVASHLEITPEHLIRDLIRDAAICLVTGNQSRIRDEIKISVKENA